MDQTVQILQWKRPWRLMFRCKSAPDEFRWGHSWVSFVSDLLSDQLGRKLVKCAERSRRVNPKWPTIYSLRVCKAPQSNDKNMKKTWHPVAFQHFQHVLAFQFSPGRRFASSPVMTSCSLGLIKMLPFTQRQPARWQPRDSNDVVPPVVSCTAGEICCGIPVDKR